MNRSGCSRWTGARSRRTLREWAASNGCFIKLDDHYLSATFLQGTRRATAVNLTTRPTATVRQSPLQIAEARAARERDQEIDRLRQELEQLKAGSTAHEAKRQRFLRKQAGRARKVGE
jgi:hypothetical protein